ncbi:MAG TPA: DUF11 domain-containing protein [Gemmataceae bacterium]|nr:DUF11 domain-containing protein [Gemmataceae bacterium]
MAVKRSIRLLLEGLDTRVVPAVDIAPPADDPDTVVVTVVDDTDDQTTDDEVTTTDDDEVIDDETSEDDDETEGGEVSDDEILETSNGGTTAASVDLDLKATVDKPAPGLGAKINVSVTITNKGGTLSSGSNVVVTIPEGLELLTATAPDGTTYDAATDTWKLSLLGPTEAATLQLQLRVKDTAAMAVGAAISSADQADPKADNNTAAAAVQPVLAKLTLSQTVSTATPVVGSWVVYTVAVKNSGPGNGAAVKVTNVLPEGLAGVRVVASSQGMYASSGVWTVGRVNAGQTATLRIVGQVTRAGELTGSATMTANGMDAETSTTEASSTLTGTRENTPANWVYLGGKNFTPAKAPKVVKPRGPVTVPTGTIPGVLNTPQAQAAARMLIAKGFVFKGMED